MSFDYKAHRDALKIMNETPDTIKRAEDRYKEKLAEIKAREATGRWSPNAITADRKAAKEDRDRVVGRLMKQMKDAVYTLNSNNSFAGETFDFSDLKFQSALNFIGLMGHDMTPQDQILTLENFRGNPGALNALGAAMKKKGLYFADRAREMTKTIPQSALEDAAYVIGNWDYSGEVDFSRMAWSKAEFRKMSERMGYDMSDAPDPYISALQDARDLIPVSNDQTEQARNMATRYKLDSAIRELNNAKQTGQGNAADIFSKAIRGIENLTRGAHDEEANTVSAIKKNGSISIDKFVNDVV